MKRSGKGACGKTLYAIWIHARGNMEDNLEAPPVFGVPGPELGSTPWLAAAFLVEVCKGQSMEKPGTGLGRGQGKWLFVIRFLCLNNARCHQGIREVTLPSCTQSVVDSSPCPPVRLRP